MRMSFAVAVSVLLISLVAVVRAEQEKTYNVKIDTLENGSITVSPSLPADGRVTAGTVLGVTAAPDPGFSFDGGYYAVPGAWGRMYYEYMTPVFQVIIDKDKSIGASFIRNDRLQGFRVIQDVVYAKPGVKPLKYDVFTPEQARNLPGIVIIHGGGWSSNTEDIMRGLARELVKGGKYVVFSIDYRWLEKGDGDPNPNAMSDLIGDVYGAIAHIQENCAQYGCDAGRLAVTGDSAGGHLAAAAINMVDQIGDGGFGKMPGRYEFLPSYMPKGKSVAQVRKEIGAAIKAAVPSYGVFGGDLLKRFAGPAADAAALQAISPINRIVDVKKRQVPHLLLRGTNDMLIKDETVRSYADALKKAGQNVRYEQVQGANHAFFDWKPDTQTKTTFEQYGVPYAAEMKAFFDSIFYLEQR